MPDKGKKKKRSNNLSNVLSQIDELIEDKGRGEMTNNEKQGILHGFLSPFKSPKQQTPKEEQGQNNNSLQTPKPTRRRPFLNIDSEVVKTSARGITPRSEWIKRRSYAGEVPKSKKNSAPANNRVEITEIIPRPTSRIPKLEKNSAPANNRVEITEIIPRPTSRIPKLEKNSAPVNMANSQVDIDSTFSTLKNPVQVENDGVTKRLFIKDQKELNLTVKVPETRCDSCGSIEPVENKDTKIDVTDTLVQKFSSSSSSGKFSITLFTLAWVVSALVGLCVAINYIIRKVRSMQKLTIPGTNEKKL